jgi:hypothetical protein
MQFTTGFPARSATLTHAGFVGAPATNFLAEVPPGRVIHSARL